MTSLQSNTLQLSSATAIAEIASAGNYFTNSAAGDVVVRAEGKNLRIGTSAGKSNVDVLSTGTVAVNSPLVSNVGLVGPWMLLSFTPQTLAVNGTMLLSEPGNPGAGYTTALGNLIGSTFPEGGSWTRHRFIVRACTSGTGLTPNTVTLQMMQANYNYSPMANAGATFGGGDGGSTRGYCTYVSPWLAGYQDIPQFQIKNVGGTTVVIGPVYIQMG